MAAPADGEAGQGPGGRPNLPGIPGSVDRVSAEAIWKYRCNSEVDYVNARKKNPPRTREHFGILHGFEVIRHPSFVDIRPAPSAPSRLSTPGGSQLGEGTMSATFHSRQAPPRTPASLIGESRPLSEKEKLNAELFAGTEKALTYFGTSVPKVIPLPTTSFVMPKYRFAHSMDHMHALEANPGSCKSAKNLTRAMSTPAVSGVK
eukprot:TRINITY_DN49652_c0_g1_i1.p1 TRINITY_DN49652_c0_g1~~TRINITY_DN49652_c0_g1_i1.p1  ORF type:complete len:204 (+),score=21.75 TRINITY_DN49652_c0_g1_i1:89-700(+)